MNHETRETAEVPRESAALVHARQRLALVAGTAGTESPEYATSLNQLALLLIMQGDPDAAEPLLRQALTIRRGTLGERHPDFATNLSSLGGLLWARGDLDQAEPLLRQAVEVRFETFGPGHPKSVVSLKSLEQLLKAKRERIGTSPAPEPPVSADAVTVEGSERIAARRERIVEQFASLGDRLKRVGEALLSGVSAFDDDLATAWAEARDGFATLRQDAIRAAKADALPLSPGGLASLADIAAFLPLLRDVEAARLAAQSGRLDAIGILDRVDRLVYRDGPTFAPLAACQAQSQALRRTIESSRPGDLPDEARRLNVRDHPLTVLLDLLASDESTTDAQWADRFDAVVAAFGKALAAAVARSRIASSAS